MKDFDVKEGISDHAIYESVDETMRDFDVTWCDRCRVLALQVPGNKGDVQGRLPLRMYKPTQ